ncbi:MAG: retroviral-like aspartic protease family protein [Planctomycetes bacterium]|nr:retroviral-like aspartic protease family protein [Planctomycetota bacterium]
MPVRTASGYADLNFVLDSGADLTMLPASVADFLGISLDGSREVRVTGVEGPGAMAKVGELTVRIGDRDYAIPCAFSTNENTPFLLGRLGLFRHFNVTFDNRRRKIALESIT